MVSVFVIFNNEVENEERKLYECFYVFLGDLINTNIEVLLLRYF